MCFYLKTIKPHEEQQTQTKQTNKRKENKQKKRKRIKMFLILRNNFKIIKNIQKYSNKTLLFPSSSSSYVSSRIFLRTITSSSISLSSPSSPSPSSNENNKGEQEVKEDTTNTTNTTETTGTETTNSTNTTNEVQQPPIDYAEVLKSTVGKTRSFASSFVVGVKEAWKELLEGPKESKIRKTVAHSEVARTKKAAEGEVDEDEETAKAYEGPTSIVVSKNKRSTWEEMAARLENSPLIREMLKNSRRISREAASTDIGKQAQKIGEQVSNKIHV